MPSTPPAALARARAGSGRTHRRAARMAAVLTAFLLVIQIAVLGIAPWKSSAASPARPSVGGASGVRLDLVSIGPASLAPGGTLTATVTATNTGASSLTSTRLELTTNTARITARADLAAWQNNAEPSPDGSPVASSDRAADALAPGQSRTYTVAVAADSLGYSTAPDRWGTRRIALTLTAEGTAVATLRTFVVWRPTGATAQISESVLLPIAASDPGQPAVDPDAYDQSLANGALSATRALASRPDVDWLLDPSILDPPAHAARRAGGGESDEKHTESASATGAGETGASEKGEGDAAEQDPAASEPTQSPEATAFAAELAASAGNRTVLTLPYAQADIASLDAAGATSLRSVLDARAEATTKAAGIVPAASIARLPGSEADPDTILAAQATGADAIMTPSSSLGADRTGPLTLSGVAALSGDTEGPSTPVLAPDLVLSDEFASLGGGAETAQTTQRLLAETATIASEPVSAPRHVLIAPDVGSTLDATAVGRTLDALDGAPWIHSARTSELLETARQASWSEQPTAENGGDFAAGTVSADQVEPSRLAADGAVERLDRAESTSPLDAGTVRAVQSDERRLDGLRSSMADTAPADDADLTTLSAVAGHWRADPAGIADRAAAASRAVEAVDRQVTVEPASSYTLVASGATVPITLTNHLDSAVTVTLDVSADKQIVRLPSKPLTVEVPARGRVTAKVPVEAVANGKVNLSVALRGANGTLITSPRAVSLTVNPSWENWTTMILVIAMGLLVVVGVLRARRHGSDRRAPAVRGPEDAGTLAHTGRSEPAREPSVGDGRDEN